jgi:aminomethyltransferase
MVVVNAGMGGVIADHLAAFVENGAVEITDRSDRVGKIDIQGPASAKILAKLLHDPQTVFASLPYFTFRGWFEQSDRSPVLLQDGTPLLLSRTGYTGEFGFELFLPPEMMETVWTELLRAGEGHGIIACGLAARDSLRAGAVLPLSHQDIGNWPFAANPWLFALALEDDGAFSKTFIGSEAIRRLRDVPLTLPFAGYDPRKIPLGGGARVVDADGVVIGEILTCATDMAIGRVGEQIFSIATKESAGKPSGFQARGLCCGFIKVVKKLNYGDRVYLSDGKRRIEVEIRRDIRPDRTARRPLAKML